MNTATTVCALNLHLGMLVWSLAITASADSLEKALALLNVGRFTEAHAALMPEHAAGNTEASRVMGCMYLNGDGVE